MAREGKNGGKAQKAFGGIVAKRRQREGKADKGAGANQTGKKAGEGKWRGRRCRGVATLRRRAPGIRRLSLLCPPPPLITPFVNSSRRSFSPPPFHRFDCCAFFDHSVVSVTHSHPGRPFPFPPPPFSPHSPDKFAELD